MNLQKGAMNNIFFLFYFSKRKYYLILIFENVPLMFIFIHPMYFSVSKKVLSATFAVESFEI